MSISRMMFDEYLQTITTVFLTNISLDVCNGIFNPSITFLEKIFYNQRCMYAFEIGAPEIEFRNFAARISSMNNC